LNQHTVKLSQRHIHGAVNGMDWDEMRQAMGATN
jgi:hypothetical protein